MNVKFSSIADRGDVSKERVVLKVLAETDVGHFAVLRTGRRDNMATTGVKDIFWFPDKAVKAGDLVVLYTKSGVQSEKTLDNGSKAHFFYWGQSAPLWGTNDVVGVVLYSSDWNTFLPEK